jgi:hypothetical protein
MSWNIKTPGDYINGPLTVAGTATITGDLTVDTSTLKVDSANDRVGIQSTLLNSRLTVRAGTIAGIDIYRDDSNANFSGIRFKGTTNSTVNAQIGWNGTQIRIDGTDEVLLVTNSSDRFRITTGGVFTWENVGGVAGTAMTLNSTGLGIGVSPRVKLDVNGGLLVNNYPTSNNYAPLSVKTTSAITTPSTFTNAINIYNTTNVGDYSNITFGYNALGLTNASAYIGFVSTSSAAGGFGDLVFGTRDVGTDTAATERVRIDASGNLLVVKTATNLQVVGCELKANGTVFSTLVDTTDAAASSYQLYSTGAAAYRFYVGLGGTVFATNTTISAISDARLKENVQDLDVGLAAILALKPRKFDWKAGKGKDIKGDRGFIAQEFETVFPNLVDEWKDPAPEGEAPYKSVRQDLIPVLVKAIQELTAEVNALKNA